MQPEAKQDRKNRRFVIAMLMWGFFGFICLCLVSEWVTLNRRDQVFTAYAEGVIQTGMQQGSSAKDIRALLLLKANDLLMTIRPEELRVTGSGQTLKATVRYYADLSMPLVNQPVYRVRFNHDLASHFTPASVLTASGQ
jgi:hypothetical protein